MTILQDICCDLAMLTDSNSSTVAYFTVNFILQFQFQLTEKIHTLQYKIAYTIAYTALSCIIFKYCYLFKNRCTIELSFLLFFLPILKKINYCTVMILVKKTTSTGMLCSLKLEKRPLNIGAVSYGIIYLMTSKTLHHYYLLNIN